MVPSMGLWIGGRPDDHSTWPPVPTPRADFPHGADDTCIREFSTDCEQCGAWHTSNLEEKVKLLPVETTLLTPSVHPFEEYLFGFMTVFVQ